MFHGDAIDVETFEVRETLAHGRTRLIADVNGVTCFVKTFGDPQTQCVADELKRVVGLPPLGVSRATIPPYGEVLVARYLPAHQRLSLLPPTAALAHALLPILWFDVWIRNNDRTGTNVLLDDGLLVPIDESAAFKRDSSFRLTPRRPWYAAVSAAWPGWTMPTWPPPRPVYARPRPVR